MSTCYTVKPITENRDEFQVAKFEDAAEPSAVYVVRKTGKHSWSCDAPSFWQLREQDKHIRLVKRFIADGEPPLTAYTIDERGISGRRFA